VPAVGTMPAVGAPYLIRGDGQSCYGRDTGDRALTTDTSGGGLDTPFIAAFGHPAFGKTGASGNAFLAPAAGAKRALDVVLPEYQRGGQDYLVAWDTATGQLQPNWPRPVNDLQFLTGPSIGDIDPSSDGEEIVSGSASHDLQGFTATGGDVAGWPKLTGDWTVANPVLGAFGSGDEKVVVGMTRAGQIFAYGTEADACSPSSWPRFHHDNANSGDARRDAVSPGRPTSGSLTRAGTLSFVSPGDDLLCGTPKRYEVRTSDKPITPAGFGGARAVSASGDPVEGGRRATLTLPAGALRRYVGVRAVDEAGNVGRPLVIDRG